MAHTFINDLVDEWHMVIIFGACDMEVVIISANMDSAGRNWKNVFKDPQKCPIILHFQRKSPRGKLNGPVLEKTHVADF